MPRTILAPAQLGSTLLGLAQLVLAALAPRGAAQCPIEELLAGDGQVSDEFGVAVAIADPWLLVGADGQDAASELGGAVYVLRRDDRGTPLLPTDDLWVEQAKLLPPPSALVMQGFGSSLDLDGAWAAIGAVYDGDGLPISGAVYIGHRDDGGTPDDPADDVWSLQAKLKDATPTSDAGLGKAVALDGAWLAAGAPFDDTAGHSAGAVVLYHRDDAGTAGDPSDDTWTQRAEFQPVAPAAYHLFGSSVGLAGGTLVIGEPKFVDLGESGLAHVYRLDQAGTPDDESDDSWQRQAELVSDDLSDSDGFGSAVALSHDWIFVGAYGDDQVGQNVGAISVFRRDQQGTPLDTSDDSWPFHAKLLIDADGYVPYAELGWSLAIDGDVLVAGALIDAVGTVQAGSVFVFRRDDAGAPLALQDDTWTVQARVIADHPGHFDFFGASVAIDAGTAVVGAPLDDDLVLTAGSAHVFAIETGPWEWLGQSLAGSGAPPCLFGSGQPIADDSVGFALHDAPAASATVIVVGGSPLNAAFKGGVLVPAPDRIVATMSGPTGALSGTARWPAGIPAGFPLWTQVWAVDPLAPSGWVASNALKLTAR
jgi:hypothetical protein